MMLRLMLAGLFTALTMVILAHLFREGYFTTAGIGVSTFVIGAYVGYQIGLSDAEKRVRRLREDVLGYFTSLINRRSG